MTQATPQGRSAGRRLAVALLPALVAFATLTPLRQAKARAFPDILPTREVAVSYDFTSRQTGPMQFEMRADPADRLIRVDFGTAGDYLLADFAQDRVRLVSPQKGLVFSVAPAGLGNFTLGPSSHLAVHADGKRHILGQTCREWRGAGRGGTGEACITRDGVILEGRAEGTVPDAEQTQPGTARPDKAHLVATAISYAPISPYVFAVPHGLREVDLPPALFRALVPGLSGVSTP